MKRFNNNQKILISLIIAPILVYLITGFLTTLNITKWNPTIKGLCLLFTPLAYAIVFAILDTFKKEEKDITRKIIKRANEIEKELLADGQTFCKSSYLMGALDHKNGEFLENKIK